MEVVIFIAGVVVGAVGILLLAVIVARREDQAEMTALVRDFDERGVAIGRRRADGSIERIDPKSIDPKGGRKP